MVKTLRQLKVFCVKIGLLRWVGGWLIATAISIGIVFALCFLATNEAVWWGTAYVALALLAAYLIFRLAKQGLVGWLTIVFAGVAIYVLLRFYL